MNEEKPQEKPQEEKIEKKEPKPSANTVLNTFMRQNKISLVFGDMQVRTLKDGAILVERPTVTAEYTT